MKDWWVKFGCFLTGYNYTILNLSSEASAKTVKRYTAAMLIVCILWSFIGFVFTKRYLKANLFGACFGAFILCVIIVQVERQIILALHRNRWMYVFRILIALTMAIIGSVIIDQIIFKEDIEQQQIYLLDAKVKKALPPKEEELRQQIIQLDSAISDKEKERKTLAEDISQHPTIRSVTTQSNSVPLTTTTVDTAKQITTKTNLVRTKDFTVTTIQNPKMSLMQPLDLQISNLREQKFKKDNALLILRPMVENEIKSKVGFLDELNVMYKLISESGVALTVWLLWLFFLMGIELFIMISKIGEQQNDYDATVLHQMELQKKKLLLLSQELPQ